VKVLHKVIIVFNRLQIVTTACSVFLTASVATAQVVTDGSLGPQVTLNGPDIQIGESLGTRSGNNLFHSFQTFNIGSGGSATFTGAPDITNVISRVTGGEVSTIQGVLRSEVGNADFYFVNPAGVTFGEGGSVDVPASFHLSTAEEILFSDGQALSTNRSTESELTIASPESFSFLGTSDGSVVLDGGTIFIGTNVRTDDSVTISANSLVVRDGAIQAPGGIHVSATGSGATRVALESGAETPLLGDIQVLNSSTIGNGPNFSPSRLVLDAGEITIGDDALVLASDSIRINSTGLTTIAGQVVSTEAGLAEITVTADELILGIQDGGVGGSSGDTTPFGEGPFVSALISANQGNITISIDNNFTIGNGLITSSTSSDVNAGNITVTSGSLEMRQSTIESDTTGIGSAGNISIRISGDATLLGLSTISSSTESAGTAGTISFTSEQLTVDGSTVRGGIVSESLGSGSAGQIEIEVAGPLSLRTGGLISSSSFSAGNAGDISIAAGELRIHGNFSGTSVERGGSTGVFTRALPSSIGDAGDIVIVVLGETRISGNGAISSSSGTDDLNFVEISNSGDAGNVLLETGLLNVDIGEISSEAEARNASAGNVTVLARDDITMYLTDVRSSSVDGAAGGVVVQSDGLIRMDWSDVITSTDSVLHDGGDITISGTAFLLERTEIVANAVSGAGGNIVVDSEFIIPIPIEGLTIQPPPNTILCCDNFIQAVSDDGVSVSPIVNALVIDVSGTLSQLNARLVESEKLAGNPCAQTQEGSASSLVSIGRGGLPVQRGDMAGEQVVTDSMISEAEVWFSETPQLNPVTTDASDSGAALGCSG